MGGISAPFPLSREKEVIYLQKQGACPPLRRGELEFEMDRSSPRPEIAQLGEVDGRVVADLPSFGKRLR